MDFDPLRQLKSQTGFEVADLIAGNLMVGYLGPRGFGLKPINGAGGSILILIGLILSLPWFCIEN